MRTIFLILCLTISVFANAQEQGTPPPIKEKLKVAIFDPDGMPDKFIRMSVREIISTVFVNTGEYIVLERELLDKIMQEQAFSNSDVVDDKQAIELGKLAGAQKAVLSVIVPLPGNNHQLSEKLIDIKTGTVEQQQTRTLNINTMSETIENVTLSLIGKQIADASKDITFFCKPFGGWLMDCVVKVFLDGKEIWTSGREGFSFIFKDKDPGKHVLQISVQGYINQPKMGNNGGYSVIPENKINTFEINTLEREVYNFSTGKLFNLSTVKLDKDKKKK